MKKSLFLASATLFALSVSASAQQFGNNNQGNNNQGNFNQNNNRNNNRNQNGGATLPLPEGVKSLVSIDAYNMLLAEVDNDGQTDYAPIIVRHVYSGGIARLFGGTSVPTDQFVSPGQLNGNNNGGGFGNNNNNNGNNPFGGNSGVSSFGGSNNSFGNNNSSGGNTFGGSSFGGGFGNNSFLMRPVPGRGN
jgi:hypothetical protein